MSEKKLTKQERENASKALASQRSERSERPKRELVWRRASDIKEKSIEWIWKKHIARGKLVMIGGDPGLGKSQVALDVAARVTTGADWPDGAKGAGVGASVVILSAEDDADDTMVPRLDFMAADRAKVYVVNASRPVGENEKLSPVNLVADIDALRETIEKIGDVALVVIDPLSEYLGGVNTDKTGEVRVALAQLRMLAAEMKFAVLVIMHLNKSEQQSAIYRVSGSMAFMALMRKVYLVTPGLQDPASRLFMPIKANVGSLGDSRTFSIEGENGDKDTPRTRVVWGSSSNLDADSVFKTLLNRRLGGDGGEKLNDAKNTLRLILKDAPQLVAKVEEEMKVFGISSATYRRARFELGVVTEKVGKKGPKDPWMLRLPPPGEEGKKKFSK